jgi:hypothetical protein
MKALLIVLSFMAAFTIIGAFSFWITSDTEIATAIYFGILCLAAIGRMIYADIKGYGCGW